jgi:hypothetical protein
MRHPSHSKLRTQAIHSLLPGRAGLHAWAGEALGPFDVPRSSERTDEQELRMHGDVTEGGSQGSQRGRCGRGRGEEASSTSRRRTAACYKYRQAGVVNTTQARVRGVDRLRARTSSSVVSVAGSRVSTTRGHWRSSFSRG